MVRHSIGLPDGYVDEGEEGFGVCRARDEVVVVDNVGRGGKVVRVDWLVRGVGGFVQVAFGAGVPG